MLLWLPRRCEGYNLDGIRKGNTAVKRSCDTELAHSWCLQALSLQTACSLARFGACKFGICRSLIPGFTQRIYHICYGYLGPGGAAAAAAAAAASAADQAASAAAAAACTHLLHLTL